MTEIAWPITPELPEAEPDPTLKNLLKEFEAFGGDTDFLRYFRLLPLKRGSSRPSPTVIDDALKSTRRFRREIGKPAWQAEIPGVKRWTKALDWLVQYLSSFRERRLADDRRFSPVVSKRGREIRRAEVYWWLGTLVPYTSLSNPHGTPKWAWIDRWLGHMGIDLPAGGSQKFWDKSVIGAWNREGKVHADIASILWRSANELPVYFSVLADMTEDEPQRQMCRRLMDEYSAAISRRMPFLDPATDMPPVGRGQGACRPRRCPRQKRNS